MLYKLFDKKNDKQIEEIVNIKSEILRLSEDTKAPKEKITNFHQNSLIKRIISSQLSHPLNNAFDKDEFHQQIWKQY